jgi:uncharacterized membrane protein
MDELVLSKTWRRKIYLIGIIGGIGANLIIQPILVLTGVYPATWRVMLAISGGMAVGVAIALAIVWCVFRLWTIRILLRISLSDAQERVRAISEGRIYGYNRDGSPRP